ncbi:MAG: hypothetical protein ACI358_03695 [Candidatus Limimorpha sp.]
MGDKKFNKVPGLKIIIVFMVFIYLINVIVSFIYKNNFTITNVFVWAIIETVITTVLFLVFFWLFSSKKEKKDETDNVDSDDSH